MEALQKYVQGLADALSAENAASLIQSAGLVVAKPGKHQKAVLTASLTTTPGLVTLAANRSVLVGHVSSSKKVMFNWQWSQNGTAWTNLATTTYATTEMPGLTLLSTYMFRVSVTIGKVTGDWSQPVSILVH